MQQSAGPLEHALLGLRATLFGEGIMRIARETAGEVLTYVSVGLLLGAVHQNLRTVVELWDAVYGEQQGEGLFQCQGVAAITQETVSVVVLDESHHTRRVRIEVVIDKRVIEAVQTLPETIGLLVLGLSQFVEETEVHDGLQVGIGFCEFRVLLPGGGIGGLGHPGLTHGVEVGVLVVEFLHPLGHGIVISIRIGVHADAVDAYSLNPPDAVLDEIAHEVGVMLVEVGHGRHEPTLGRLLEVDF